MSSQSSRKAIKNNGKGTQKAQRTERKYSVQKKILPALLLSLTAPLTVCFFGPFEIYYSNMQEFLFSLGDFFALCAIFSLLFASVIFVSLMLIDGKAYEITSGVIVWLSLMFFVQRNYLNLGINAVAGDGVGTASASIGVIIINALIWLAVGAGIICAVIFLRKKHIEAIMTAFNVGLIAILGAQIISFATLSLTSDVYLNVTARGDEAQGDKSGKVDFDETVLTYENFNTLADKNNIVFFIVDRFDAKYYRKMAAEQPEFFDRLDGFTYYDDYTSLYCRTYPAVMSILTGYEADLTKSKEQNFKEIYSKGGHLQTLKNSGYNINLYTEKNYAYHDAAVLSKYASNTSDIDMYYIDSKIALSWDMIRLSLNSHLPFVAKSWAGYLSTPDFNAHAIYRGDDDMYTVDENSTSLSLERLSEAGLSTVKSRGQFTFIHLYGCHDTTKSTIENIELTFEFIYQYIDEMKRLGLYDDATIIITGDHGAILSDSKLIGETDRRDDDGTRVTAMLFKKSGESGMALKTSSSQISQDELWATIYESEGMLDKKRGDSFFDIPEGEDRVRRFLFEVYRNKTNNGYKYNKLVEYRIRGTANDGDNWEIANSTDIVK